MLWKEDVVTGQVPPSPSPATLTHSADGNCQLQIFVTVKSKFFAMPEFGCDSEEVVRHRET